MFASFSQVRAQVTVIACVAWIWPSLATAALVPLSFEQLTSYSQYVVSGEVVEMRSYRANYLDLGTVLFTDVTVRLDAALKAQRLVRGSTDRIEPIPASDLPKTLTLQVLGGRIGEEWQHCPESPRFEMGERVLVFARPYNGKLWTTGWLQGKYRITSSPGGFVVEGGADLPISGPDTLSSVRLRVEELSRMGAALPGQPGSAPGTSLAPPESHAGRKEVRP